MPTNPDTAKALADLREWVDADNAHADPECACNIIRAYGPTLIAALELAERVAALAADWKAPNPEYYPYGSSGRYWLQECAGELRTLVPITDDASSGGG